VSNLSNVYNKFAKKWGRDISPTVLLIFVVASATTLFALCPILRLSRYMVLCYALIIGSGLLLFKTSAPTGALFIWLGVICYIHKSTPILAALAILMYAIVLLYIIIKEIKRPWIYNTVCVLAMICACSQWLQFWDIAIIFKPVMPGQYTGILGNPNETSAFMAVCLPGFFRRRWIWFIFIPITGLFLAKSLIGVMASAIIGCAWLVSRRSRISLRTACLAAVLICVAVTGYMVHVDHFNWQLQKNSRLIVWQESITASLYKSKSLTGWGFGQYSVVIPMLTAPLSIRDVRIKLAMYAEIEDKKAFIDLINALSKSDVAGYYKTKIYPNEAYFEAHNDYVEILFAAGMMALVLLITAIAHSLWSGWRNPDRIPFYGLLASCAAAGVFFVWQIVPIAIVSIVWAGLCLSARNQIVAGLKSNSTQGVA